MKSKYLSFIRQNKKFLGYGITLAFFSSFGQTYFIGLFSANIRGEFDLTHGSFGTIYTISTAISAVILIWFGRLIDKIDLRIFTILTCVMLILASFLIAFSPNIIILAFALFMLRFSGQGLMTHTYTTAIGRYFNKDRGKALSISTLGHPLGEAVFPSIVVMLIVFIGWRETWIAFGVIGLIFLLPFVLWLLGGHVERHQNHIASVETINDKKKHDWTVIELAHDPRFYAIMTAILAPAFLLTGVFFHQVHLADYKGWSMPWLATSFTVFALTSVVTMIGSGILIDRISAAKTLMIIPFPLALAMSMIAFFSNEVSALILMAASGFCIGMVFTSGSALWPEIYGEKNLGAIRSLVTALIIAASSISPAVFGWLIDSGISMNEIALGGIGWSFISIIVMFLVFMRKGFK
tara:strand:- start:1613 stop:2836 length:1224 start_codon:yes stop_codon:yes gene_type:complete